MENEGLKTKKNKNPLIPRRRVIIYLGVLLVLLILVLADQYFVVRKNKVSAPDNTQENIDRSKDYQRKAQEDLQNNNYPSAIENSDKAIESDPSNSQAYAQKSEAEYAAGDKEAAKETVREGLEQDPDNELLKSKLDVLEKGTFSDPNLINTRE